MGTLCGGSFCSKSACPAMAITSFCDCVGRGPQRGPSLAPLCGRRAVLGPSLFLCSNGHFQERRHIGPQPYRDGKLAQAFDRLLKLDKATINVKARILESLSNIHSGNRAKKLPFFAGPTRKMTRHTLQRAGKGFCLFFGPSDAVLPQVLFMVKLTLVLCRSSNSKPARDKKIASISVRYLDNITNLSQLFNILRQDHF